MILHVALQKNIIDNTPQCIQMQLADLGEAELERHESALEFFRHDDKEWFYLDGFIKMITTADHWDLEVTILEPGEELRYEDTANESANHPPAKRQKSTKSRRQKNTELLKVDDAYPYKTLCKITRPIWDKYCSNAIHNVHAAAPDTSQASAVRKPKPRKGRAIVIPRTMVTRLDGTKAKNSLIAGTAGSRDQDVEMVVDSPSTFPSTPSTPVSTTASDNDIRSPAKRPPSGRRGIKSENTSRRRMLYSESGRPMWDAIGYATPSPETYQGSERSNALNTPPMSVPKSRLQEPAPELVRETISTLSRLKALQGRYPGQSAEDVLGT